MVRKSLLIHFMPIHERLQGIEIGKGIWPPCHGLEYLGERQAQLHSPAAAPQSIGASVSSQAHRNHDS